MKYVVSVNNQKFEVEVEKGKATIFENAIAAPAATVQAPVTHPHAAAPTNVDGQKVLAPMPGVILQVKAPAGSTIKKGAPLVILEAMKMENEVVSPCDGTVTFAVAKGSQVSTGDILVVIK
jgi:glutaconyl-CoA/methylmalonyl-CoA decarboxylase subunit gamma